MKTIWSIKLYLKILLFIERNLEMKHLKNEKLKLKQSKLKRCLTKVQRYSQKLFFTKKAFEVSFLGLQFLQISICKTYWQKKWIRIHSTCLLTQL